MQFPDPISNIFLGPIPHIFRSNIKHIFRSNTSHFQVQYHTFPTIEDTLFRQDINGKGEATFNMVTSNVHDNMSEDGALFKSSIYMTMMICSIKNILLANCYITNISENPLSSFPIMDQI